MAEIEIDRDEQVVGPDGNEIGRVKHVIVDGPSRQVTDLVVEQHGAEFLVPLASVERGAAGTLMMRETAAATGNRGMFARDAYHEVDDDAVAGRATNAPGATLEQANPDSAIIADNRERAAMPTEARQQPVREQTGRREQTTAREGENITVPVVEERLKAGVRETEAGKFRLSKRVVEERKTIDVPVEHEEVYVTETAVTRRPATAEELKMRGRDIEVPMRDQEVVTSKEARVTGEVDVRKEMAQETERVTDTVRREEVHVEDPRDPHIHVENEGKRKQG
ncbi:MAG: YsnF/AvaK domain-containing protein [Actinomycetota bacterium]|nr:YsnF/AvaK domain-containing protein [Actinomycetota bacterium]